MKNTEEITREEIKTLIEIAKQLDAQSLVLWKSNGSVLLAREQIIKKQEKDKQLA